MKSSRSSWCIAGLATLCVASVALGQLSRPGWRFGRDVCGPVGNPGSSSLAGCNTCCQAHEDDPLTPGQLADCLKYCATVYAAPGVWINPAVPGVYP
jgi:hypothetical protein